MEYNITTGEIIEQRTELFVSMDAHKTQHMISTAKNDGSPVKRYGKIANNKRALKRLVNKLSAKVSCKEALHFCYEAGGCGYKIYRDLTDMGVRCSIVAPSRIPRESGDRRKNDKRDADKLAKYFRSGLLTEIWVPDEGQEAIRDLTRSRTDAVNEAKRFKQRISALLLKYGHVWSERSNWTQRHWTWLSHLSFPNRATRIVFDELLDGLRIATGRAARLDKIILEMYSEWDRKPLVDALMTLRGVKMTTAMIIASELGDLRRFPDAGKLMGYVGLIVSETMTGDKGRKGGITKTGNKGLRRILVQSAGSYSTQARKSAVIRARNEGQPQEIQDIAWNAQIRLCKKRWRMLSVGKNTNVIKTAQARELCGFIWAIGQIAMPLCDREALRKQQAA